MPEVTELNDENEETNNSSPQNEPRNRSLWAYISANHIDIIQGILRLVVLYFFISYIFSGAETADGAYKKCLLAYGAASALRLHQRVGRLSRETLGQLTSEDAFHYLLYVLMFSFSGCSSFVLYPIVIMSFAKTVMFIPKVANDLNYASNSIVQKIAQLRDRETITLLKLAAGFEIGVLPMTIMLLFTGKGMLFAPFLYFQFLKARYMSRRNPYTRLVFREARLALEHTAYNSKYPIIQKTIKGLIGLVMRFAPPEATAQ